MRKNRHKTLNWIRFGMKCGLLATDASVWAAIAEFLEERSYDVKGAFRRTDRLGDTVKIHRGRPHFKTLLIGLGVGAGVGMLLAPVTGQSAREFIGKTASDIKKKFGGETGRAFQFGSDPETASRYAS